MKKVLVLVLASADGIHEKMVQSIRQTWGKETDDRFRVMYYYSLFRDEMPPDFLHVRRPSDGKTVESGDTIICGCPDGMYLVTLKTVMAFEHILGRTFDYVLRCCSGSYIDRDELHKFLSDKPTDGFYCGYIGRNIPTHPFASGSGFLLSKDLVRLTVERKEQLFGYGYEGYLDDVAIGRLMYDCGIQVQNAPRVDDSTVIQKDQFHYHFRTSPEFMHEIHSKLKDARVT